MTSFASVLCPRTCAGERGRRSLRQYGLVAFVLALLGLSTPWPARAGLMLVVSPQSYTASVGDTFDLNVYLQQSSPINISGGEPDLSSTGLFSAAIVVTFSTVAQVTQITPTSQVYVDPSDPTNNDPLSTAITPATSPSPPNNGAAYLSFALINDLGLGTLPVPDPNGQILLGTFAFMAASPGSETVTAMVDPSFGGEGFLDGTGVAFDSFVNPGSAQITVQGSAVVPEPYALVMGGTAILMGLAYTARRRRRAAS